LRYGFSPARVYYLATEAFADTYSRETILHWMKIFYRRFFNQQFKRSCLADGPKVGSVCLSPRGDWRMPSDAASALWLAQVEQL
jgi:NAD+ synthase (glutamine-hydrolysing)